MNKKILIPTLLFSLVGLIAFQTNVLTSFDIATSLKIFSFPSTNAQQTISELEQQIISTRNAISTLETERNNVTEVRDRLVRNAIISSGCLLVEQSITAAGEGAGVFLGIPYFCPAPDASQATSDSPTEKLDNELRLINPQLLPLSSQINQLTRDITGLRETLRILLSQMASQTAQAGTVDATDSPSDTGSTTGTTSADGQLLNTFYSTTDQEILAEREEYFMEAAIHASAGPIIQAQGPNGFVSASVENGVISLNKEVTLRPNESLEIPQIGLRLVNRNTTKISARENLLISWIISKARAQDSANLPPVSVPLGGGLSLEIDISFPFQVSASEERITIEFLGFTLVTLVDSTSGDGSITLSGGSSPSITQVKNAADNAGVSNAISGDPNFITDISSSANSSSCQSAINVNSTVGSCIEACLEKTVKVCLECNPAFPQTACKTTVQNEFCEETCKTAAPLPEPPTSGGPPTPTSNEPAPELADPAPKESILDGGEIEEVIVIC